MEGSTHSSGTEVELGITTLPTRTRDTLHSEATPLSVPPEHLQIAEKHITDQPLQEKVADEDPYNGRSKRKVAVIMLALCTAVFLGTLDSTIVTTALPTITENFNSASGYTWIGSAFSLANASTIPSWGKASDIFGRKPMLLLANVVFMIGSLVAALSNSVGMLVAARAVQGLGSGGLVITPIIEGLKAIDWIGSFLVIGATLMFLFGIQYGGETYPWNSAIVICLITFGLSTFALFLLYECKVPKYPIMDLSFLNSRSNIATLSTAFIHGLVFISGTYYLPLYFQAVRGATPIFSGIYLLPTALAASASSFAAGIFVRNHGAYLPPIYTGFLIMTVGFGLFVDLDVHSTWVKLVTYQIIAGVGFGALFQAPFIALQAHIHPRDIGVATTTLGFTRQMATSISVVIGQAVYQNAMTAKTEELTTSLGPDPAGEFSGGGVVANAGAIDALPGYQREVVRNVLAESLQPMWVMYTVFSSVGLLA
ncbi:putative major facilitator superfamily transporter, partial [Aureobasidium pullulans]